MLNGIRWDESQRWNKRDQEIVGDEHHVSDVNFFNTTIGWGNFIPQGTSLLHCVMKDNAFAMNVMEKPMRFCSWGMNTKVDYLQCFVAFNLYVLARELMCFLRIGGVVSPSPPILSRSKNLTSYGTSTVNEYQPKVPIIVQSAHYCPPLAGHTSLGVLVETRTIVGRLKILVPAGT